MSDEPTGGRDDLGAAGGDDPTQVDVGAASADDPTRTGRPDVGGPSDQPWAAPAGPAPGAAPHGPGSYGAGAAPDGLGAAPYGAAPDGPGAYPPGYGYGYPYGGYGYAPPQQYDHPQGTTVLILGILGVVTCQILGPVAWFQGNKVLAEIDAAPGVYGNRGLVVAGRACGIVATVLLGISVAFLALYVAVIGLAVAAGAAGA